MGDIKPSPDKCRLFFGLLAANHELLEKARARLARDYSPVDYESAVIPFTFSKYYDAEMGGQLLRQWISTERLIHITELPDIKQHTNRLETLYVENEKRRVNIDPGYVNLAKVVLATTKDYEHRLYIRDGIFEEVTLHFRRAHGFVAWPWTYPDYQSETACQFFAEVRNALVLAGEAVAGETL